VATALFAANRLGKANDKRDTNNYNGLLLNSLVKTAHDLQKIINVPSLFYFCRGDIRTLPPRSLQGAGLILRVELHRLLHLGKSGAIACRTFILGWLAVGHSFLISLAI
jgi:hypothetical protein